MRLTFEVLVRTTVGSGEWEVGSEKWGVEGGECEVGGGEWEVGSGELGVESGEWEVGSGEWGVGSGEWEGRYVKLQCIHIHVPTCTHIVRGTGYGLLFGATH